MFKASNKELLDFAKDFLSYAKTLYCSKLREYINKKQKLNDEIEKELVAAEKEIKNLKKSSTSNISLIATEIATEVIKQVIDTEANKSNVTAIVEDLAKKKSEKYI